MKTKKSKNRQFLLENCRHKSLTATVELHTVLTFSLPYEVGNLLQSCRKNRGMRSIFSLLKD
jgi:hypothetical protein